MNNKPDKKRNMIVGVLVKFVRMYRRHRINLTNFGKCKWGGNSYIGSGAEVYIPEHAVIMENVSIGGNFISQTNMLIGSNSLISTNVSFIGNDHDLSPKAESAYHSGRQPASTIELMGDNFIGFGAIILGSVRIGKGAVVAAGALVNKDVPEGVVVAGVPSKIIKKRAEL